MRHLIVTADDFGADPSVNQAILRGVRDGILTCASLMVAAPAAADAVALAKLYPGLKVGLHLVLIDGKPMLPPEKIPDLVGPDGNFRDGMAKSAAAMFFLPWVRKQVAAEIEAQFQAFAANGLALDHVNAHKHFHLVPTIAHLILKIGAKYGLKAMRLPYEPPDIMQKIAPELPAGPEAFLAQRLADRLRAHHIFHPDRMFGLAWTGAMTEKRLCALLHRLPEGVNEIYFHPGFSPSYPGSAPGYAYQAEADALVSQQAIDIIRKNQIYPTCFGAFPTPV